MSPAPRPLRWPRGSGFLLHFWCLCHESGPDLASTRLVQGAGPAALVEHELAEELMLFQLLRGDFRRKNFPLQEIDRRLEKKLKITQKESRKSKSPPKVPLVIQDESLPAGPPPQIRILKRPTTNGVLSNPNSASRPAFPVKSLAQREAEYAEARKRILGSASPEEEQEKPILDR
ncbi:PREDICTED: SUZ domain-containing protein 1 [Tinamus guttatus]|nr:PREDICTED: SUZ domain-containing protein 1 [Tinamus guttatus]